MTAVPPRPAAPDVDTDTGALREAIAQLWMPSRPDIADRLLTLPALRDLIAERDQAVAAVGRVRELAEAMDREAVEYGFILDRIVPPGDSLRRALDGAT